MSVESKRAQSDNLPASVLEKAKELNFKGKPLEAVKYVNKLHPPTGNREHDLAAGNIAFMVGDELQISPAVGNAYFKCNFVKEN